MAKLKGPGHSDSASGAFNKCMIFRKTKNGSVLTNYYKPGSRNSFTPSVAQLAQRSRYADAIQTWRDLSLEDKNFYNTEAKNAGDIISGWNFFLKAFMKGIPVVYDFIASGINGSSVGSPNGGYLNSGSTFAGHPYYICSNDDGDWALFNNSVVWFIVPLSDVGGSVVAQWNGNSEIVGEYTGTFPGTSATGSVTVSLP